MTFDPNTIQHLGIKMYSRLPAALAELLANAYDADATKVEVKLYDKGDKKIVVVDDGHGMNFEDINQKFLVIGRNRRNDASKHTPKNRLPSGKKGLGKLALFGLGNTISIETKSQGEETTKFTLDWNDMKKTKGTYFPKIEAVNSNFSSDHGTIITISKLKRVSTFDAQEVAKSIARLFNYVDSDFKVSVARNDELPVPLSNESKLPDKENVERTWTEFKANKEYDKSASVIGKIVTTEKPLRSNQRGIALYANGRLVNEPGFFGDSESSHFYSYVTGILNIDFIDEPHGEYDLILTNRRSLDWDQKETKALRKYLEDILGRIQTEWREKRNEEPKKNTGIDDIEAWFESLPKDKRKSIEILLNSKEDNATIPKNKVLKTLHDIAPEHAELHWRYLNENIKSSENIKKLYKEKNYHGALFEAIKIYVKKVKGICMSAKEKNSEYSLMGKAFGENGVIKLTNRSNLAEINIEDGHRHFSQGLIKGFRNQIAHEPTEDLEESLITKKACLDILSLLSHLFDRLEKGPLKKKS